MLGGNATVVREFVLLGLAGPQGQQRRLSALFLCMYLLTVAGNTLIMLAIGVDARLHSPMYFFLSNLAMVDVCFSSTTVPQMAALALSHTRTIPFARCLAQLFFFITFVNMDSLLLGVMAYDRYVAICQPLRYAALMRPQLCAGLVAGLWVLAGLHALLHTALMARLSFCASNVVHHFFCDLHPLLQLSCSDVSTNVLVIFTVGGLLALTPFVLILVSYGAIAAAVLRLASAQGRGKAFSTCGAHLAVVALFYGTAIAVYFGPSSSHSPQRDTLSAVMYTVVTPMLNPFIYSLRNRDMKGALRGLLCGARAVGGPRPQER
ncbi:olfactory receptor 1C1-like [Talpa occidentalis]|uniref:olfactory receptor 1C1-like n=1 Tax=Talpa occidentalis TaxID=50954 RepID=UPI00188F8D84|nr:olfactory receptor 1C1-like [Talpa occidentalis]